MYFIGFGCTYADIRLGDYRITDLFSQSPGFYQVCLRPFPVAVRMPALLKTCFIKDFRLTFPMSLVFKPEMLKSVRNLASVSSQYSFKEFNPINFAIPVSKISTGP